MQNTHLNSLELLFKRLTVRCMSAHKPAHSELLKFASNCIDLAADLSKERVALYQLVNQLANGLETAPLEGHTMTKEEVDNWYKVQKHFLDLIEPYRLNKKKAEYENSH